MRIPHIKTLPGTLYLLGSLLAISCQQNASISGEQLFTLMPESHTGADFVNHLDYDEQLKKKFNIQQQVITAVL